MLEMIWNHLWQSTLFAGAVATLALAFRNNRAHVRYWLWLAASVKFLIPFSALLWIGAQIELVPIERSGQEIIGVLDNAAEPFTQPPLVRVDRRGRPMPPPPPTPLSTIAERSFTILWPAGAIAVLLTWAVRWRRVATSVRAATEITDSPVLHALRRLEGDASRIRLVKSSQAIEPGVFGIVSPVLMWPDGIAERLSLAQIEAILAHEVAHVHRRDNLAAMVHMAVEALFWFHPLVWFIGVQLREERERACDEAVLERGHDAADYAGGILEVCRHCATAHAPDAVAALAGNLTQRIRHILASAPPLSLGFLKAAALTACTLVVALLPLIAGAMDDVARRRVLLSQHVHVLEDAVIYVRPLARHDGDAPRLEVDGNEIAIRNSSLRQLVALAYGVDPDEVTGGGNWMDEPRYDFRAVVAQRLTEPEDFQPAALRGLVNKLLGSRFDLEIHVNQRCQVPCGRDAQARTVATR